MEDCVETATLLFDAICFGCQPEPAAAPPSSKLESCSRLLCPENEQQWLRHVFAADFSAALPVDEDVRMASVSLFLTDPLTDSVPGRLVQLAHLSEPFTVLAHREHHEYSAAQELRAALKDVHGWPLNTE